VLDRLDRLDRLDGLDYAQLPTARLYQLGRSDSATSGSTPVTCRRMVANIGWRISGGREMIHETIGLHFS